MEIKPPNDLPRLTDLNVNKDQDQKPTSAAQPAGVSAAPDQVEVSNANPFQDAVQAAADQNEGNTDEAHLNSEQQNLISKFKPQDEHLQDASFFLKDAKSTDQDRKNSGLQFPGEKPVFQNPVAEREKADAQKINNYLKTNLTGNQQTSDAVNDVERFASEDLRKGLNDGVAQNTSSLNSLVGSQGDRLKGLLDPAARGPQNGPTYGKGAIEEDKGNKTPDNSTDPQKAADDQKAKTDRWLEQQKIQQKIFELQQDLQVNKAKTPDKGGGKWDEYIRGSYDPENYHAKLPADIQKLTDFIKQQMQNMRGSTGGETVHTVDDVGTQVSGAAESLIAKQGNLGLFGNPGEAPVAGGTTGSGHLGANQAGGAIDYGPDSDKSGWSGITHQDDPGSVQFGPSDQPKGTTDSQGSDSSSSFDPDALRAAMEKLRELDPTALARLLESLNKSE